MSRALCIFSFLGWLLHAVPWSLADELDSAVDAPVDYVSEIRPILSDRCFTCHGPDAAVRATELRLDDEDSVHKLAVVPGNADASELIRRIESSDADVVMPPPDSNLQLSATERELLRRWVDAGARFEKHWSFVPLRSHQDSDQVPAARSPTAAWADSRNPIDIIVGNKLESLGLVPSPEADRLALIRRLSLDLNGLLPKIDEADIFAASQDPEAYERLVDQLLARPEFGEKWAVDWLDAARYADTYGYQADVYRAMWPWRDWVIHALNSNLPYDQFITWQLAGDLLPNPTQEQIIATAFNRNHRQTNEGGSVEEEFRAEYVADRVNTFGAAFLGLTLECARCHDHKYDPISQREYYQLAAFFNSIDESGLYSHFTSAIPTPTLALTTPSQQHELSELSENLAAKEKLLYQLKGGLTSAALSANSPGESLASIPSNTDGSAGLDQPTAIVSATDIEARLSLQRVAHYRFESHEEGKLKNESTGQNSGKVTEDPKLVEGVSGNCLLMSGEDSAIVPEGGSWTRNQPFSLSFWVDIPQHFARCVLLHRSRAWTDAGSRGYEVLIEDGRASVALVHFWPGNAIRILSMDKLPLNQWTQIGVTYDGSSRAEGLRLYVNGQLAATEVVRDCLSRAIHGSEASEVTIGQRFRDVGFKHGKFDELQMFQSELTALEMQYLYGQVSSPDGLKSVLANASQADLQQFQNYGRPERHKLEEELLEIRDRISQSLDSIPEIMVMRELDTPRPTYILHRGEYHLPGEQVERGLLSQIFEPHRDTVTGAEVDSNSLRSELSDSHGRQTTASLTRLDLAAWLTHPHHPLTARVVVNRIWQSIFGQGLVATSEDFGFQGATPVHPELLDWLAQQFVQSGWDLKALIKTIVMSKVYRQSSDPSSQQAQSDPENRWMARGPAVRLSAEAVRDAALCASGLLVQSIGGPPVKPYQPDGLWEEKSNASYQRDIGVGSHRRSIYTFWKRTSPPPMMMTFDASNREVCVVRRQSTMTPLQNLVLLNDPQFVEAARGLAESACLEATELEERLELAFRRLVTRKPSDCELAILLEMYQQQLQYFRENTELADKYLVVGDHRVDVALDRSEVSALSVVCQGLMSFDEFVMKR